ncbi:MAG: patatin-like phospholipase family protein [Acidobacteriota bacterium]
MKGRLSSASRRFAWKVRPPVLALGGGGARGFAHIGVLQELDRHSLPISSITGTSMGAIVGAMYASLGSGQAVFEKWREALKRDLIPSPPRSSRSRGREQNERPLLQAARRFRNRLVVSFALHQPSMLDGTSIVEAIEFLLPDINIEDLPLRFSAVATDLETGQSIRIDRGPLRAAVNASGAVPGVLPAVEIDGRHLVDGGVVAEIPVREARVFGRPVFAVDVSMDLGKPSEEDIALDTMMRTQTMTASVVRQNQLHDARWVLRPEVGHATWSDWDLFEELVEAGAKAMKMWLGGER